MKVIPLSEYKRHPRGKGAEIMRSLPFRKKSLFPGHKLSLDRRIVWWIGVACAVFGVLTQFNLVIVPPLAGYSNSIVLGGLILLLIALR